ncbi:MAG: hypothetical protein L0Z53_21360, partial [Acidobacteriales bacterium]|nr:hypothetical protein [Terriglobales bacterium]
MSQGIFSWTRRMIHPRLSVMLLLCLPSLLRADDPFRYPEAKHGRGEMKYINGLPVLRVEGTPEEIGEQIGVLGLKPAAHLPKLAEDFVKKKGWEKIYPLLLRT